MSRRPHDKSLITSAFFNDSVVSRIRTSAERTDWGRRARRQMIDAAAPWTAMSDASLWDLMFGPTLPRSWMVWSDGFCPACRRDVRMYDWRIDAFARPWKVECPQCGELFPKNDFGRYYRSGLDRHGVFQFDRADRNLLFNGEHPDPSDPLHRFGVDDGRGYTEGENRWRFVGAYLIYGQWKQLVLGGIRRLSDAYVITGERRYAHQAAVLLDRVADMYPGFNFAVQAEVYETQKDDFQGYVSVWHDACEETRELALAYDKIRCGLEGDEALVAFLSEQAKRYDPPNRKRTLEEILANIETNILADALDHRRKIYSNYPRQDITVLIIEAVLGWPGNRQRLMGPLDAMIARATAVDGVTGEKGLAGYSNYVIDGLARFLGYLNRLDASLVDELFERHPALRSTYAFHIDTLCLDRYYPRIGDTGYYAGADDRYVGLTFSREPSLEPSGFSFLWGLYRTTGDARYVQAMHRENGLSETGLPYDLLCDDPDSLQAEVRRVIQHEGASFCLGSVRKDQWHLAILRSGAGRDARALWTAYDNGGGHGHRNAMAMGLFARGLDLLPDFGYCTVHFGGWSSPKGRWYTMAAAHNTVVVDGEQMPPDGAGRLTAWADGRLFRAAVVSGPHLIDGRQYERTLAIIDVDERDFYVLDVFRVVGGNDHAKFIHGHFGTLERQGFNSTAVEEYGHETQFRPFRGDRRPSCPWQVDWCVEDRYRLIEPDRRVRLRYTDLTREAEAWLGETWVVVGSYDGPEAWIPSVMARRRSSTAPLASTFVGVFEPYENRSRIRRIRRLDLRTSTGRPAGDSHVALEVQLADGRRDLLVAVDVEDPLGTLPGDRTVVEPSLGLRFDGRLAWVRLDAQNAVRHATMHGGSLRLGGFVLQSTTDEDFVETDVEG